MVILAVHSHNNEHAKCGVANQLMDPQTGAVLLL